MLKVIIVIILFALVVREIIIRKKRGIKPFDNLKYGGNTSKNRY